MTQRRRILSMIAGAGGAAGLGLWHALGGARGSSLELVRRSACAMGTDVTIVALHASRPRAEGAIDAAFREIDLVDELMSLYRPDSELSRLNRDRILEHPHPYLLSVLRQAQRVSIASDGAFDVTVQPLWELYAGAVSRGGLPDDAAIEAVRRQVDYRRLELTPGRVRLREEGTGVTLNGIAQGFAADLALAALRRHGVEHALVDSGELGALGHKRDGEPWTAGIRHPRREDDLVWVARPDGRCMATSGDYETFFTPDHSCHHIFDPATGRSPQAFSSVTVLAWSGTEADALSTAAFVLGVQRGLRLIEAWHGADALFVLKDDRVLATTGFPGRHPSA
jgi:thiamine biosynthesis lipoprotein